MYPLFSPKGTRSVTGTENDEIEVRRGAAAEGETSLAPIYDTLGSVDGLSGATAGWLAASY